MLPAAERPNKSLDKTYFKRPTPIWASNRQCQKLHSIQCAWGYDAYKLCKFSRAHTWSNDDRACVRRSMLRHDIVAGGRSICGNSSCPIGSQMLTLSMFFHGHDQWSYFNGNAADTRNLVYVLLDICKAHNSDSPRDIHRIRMLECLCAMYDCCFGHGHHILRVEAERMLSNCVMLLVQYNWLCNHSLDNWRLCYNLVVKLHMFWHMGCHTRHINP